MRALLPILAVLVVAAQPAPAEACSPPLPGFTAVRPADGASVPSNFVAYVSGYDIFPFEAYWRDFDVFLPMETGRLGRLGTAQLTVPPGTVEQPFELTFEGPREGGSPLFEPLQVNYRMTFLEDRAAPVFDATPELQVSFQTEVGGLCTPPGYHVRVRVAPATDDFGVAAYVLREARGASEEEPVVASRLAPGPEATEVALTAFPGENPGPRCYRLVAYDFAGNAAATPVACFDPNPGADAGVTLDAGSPRPEPDAGA